MRIAVIDDGVAVRKAMFVERLIFDVVCMNGTIRKCNEECNEKTHGTAVADLIQYYAPKEEIGSIKIMDNHKNGDIQNLIAAVAWCIGKKIDVIHMSIGTTWWKDIYLFEKKLLPLLSKSNQIRIVAAKNNEGFFCAPAGLKNVWAVSKATGKGIYLKKKETDAWEITANLCMPQELCSSYGKKLGLSNSFQAAAVTGVLVSNGIFSQPTELTKKMLVEILKSVEDNVPCCAEARKKPLVTLSEIPIVWIRISVHERWGLIRLFEKFQLRDYHVFMITDNWKKPLMESVFYKNLKVIEIKELQRILSLYEIDFFMIISSFEDVNHVSDLKINITKHQIDVLEDGVRVNCVERKKRKKWYIEVKKIIQTCYE